MGLMRFGLRLNRSNKGAQPTKGARQRRAEMITNRIEKTIAQLGEALEQAQRDIRKQSELLGRQAVIIEQQDAQIISLRNSTMLQAAKLDHQREQAEILIDEQKQRIDEQAARLEAIETRLGAWQRFKTSISEGLHL